MKDWERFGRDILDRQDLVPAERALLEAHLSLLSVEISNLQATTRSSSQVERPQAAEPTVHDRTVASQVQTADANVRLTETERLLRQAIGEFNTQPHTPELVTKTFQAIWQARGERVGTSFEVTPCPFTQEEIAGLEQSGKRLGYLPPELATQQTRHILGKMFPKMQSQSVQEDNSVTNDESPSGWFDYEAAIDAPYLSTNEEQLMARIAEDRRKILSLNQYIVAGQDSKLFTNKYLDEVRTWVRVGSRSDGRIVVACFYSDGRLGVYRVLWADFHPLDLGGRSSGVNRA